MHITPTITIDVDLCNPGQYYACCGLLELAHRTWGCDALGWFEESMFHLHAPNLDGGDAEQELLDVMRTMSFTAVMGPEESGSPLLMQMGPKQCLLNWWLKIVDPQSLRTWGRGTSFKIITTLHNEAIRSSDIRSGWERQTSMKGVLSVDPRSAWTALDAGFSPNEQNLTVSTYPLIEFLAGIGLQRHRPRRDNRVWLYDAWQTAIPSPLAPAARHIFPQNDTTPYQFELASRGQMARYFTYSIQGDR